MKKLLLLLFSASIGFSQITALEIKLVDANVGTSNFNGTNSGTTESNDPGLNAIFQNYNVSSYMVKYGHLYPPFEGRFTEILCDQSEATQLKNDLIAYSSVVESVRNTYPSAPFSDCLYAQINTLGNGIPIGINNGIVVTNDDGLNQIFEDFDVYFYVQTAPGAINEALQRTYNVVCNCDNIQLKTALDNYDNIINYTEFISPGYLLNNTAFEKTNPVIAPNPFSSTFSIQTEESISNYLLIDSIGKQLLNTNSKSELDAITPQLNQGVYILNLQFENGKSAQYKLIKS
ncbi:MAG: T9SS type A sorting domain-containing protein [Flavobacteriales bacterium]|nr:T9SS type A sorting domain-containing protein [Flavobacteriales bacterium]